MRPSPRAPLLLALLLCTVGCRSYVGTARDIEPSALDRPGWIAVRDVRFAHQQAESDCGAAAIGMVVGYWTGSAPDTLAAALRPAPESGIKAGRLRDFAHSRGLAAFLIAGALADLEHELGAGRPVLVGLVKPQRKGVLTHYEVVIGFHPRTQQIVTLDPAEGLRQNSVAGFLAEWKPAGHLALVVSAPPRAR